MPDEPDLQEVLDAIAEIKSEMGLLLKELQKIVKLLHGLPAQLERNRDFPEGGIES
jgi:hypothetical protein